MTDTDGSREAHSSVYRGYRIDVSQSVSDPSSREPLPMRALAAISPWGLQDDLWQWAVFDGDALLASDQELSKVAAVEGARYWVDTYAPEPSAR